MKRSVSLLLLLLPIVALSQSRTTIKYGYVDTDLRKEESEDIFRRSIGIGREYFPRKNGSFYFSYGLTYLRKASLLKYRSWSSGYDDTVYFGHITADVAFVELPIQFGYQMRVMGSNLFLAFSTGLSLSMPVADFSKSKRIRDYYYGSQTHYKAMYSYWDEQGLESGMNAVYSAAIFYRFAGFEIQYSRALGETLGFSGITVRDYFDCWQFLFRLSF